MRKSLIRLGFGFTFLWLSGLLPGTFARPFQPAAIPVEPADLVKRYDLISREVIVDDRLRYFQFHPGQGYDEIQLKRTPVIFRLPRPLRPQSVPGNPAIQIRGVLKREGDQMICDVSSFQLFPTDVERLDQALARLSTTDFQSRKAWSAWALQRAEAFDDKPLHQKALLVEGDALRIEANTIRDADLPRVWMQLAEEARHRQIPEPEPSALAHKAFRAKLANVSAIKELDELVAAIERFFPQAKTRNPEARLQPDNWRADYAKDPGNGYRSAPAEARTLFDRRLWGDAVEKRLEVSAKNNPSGAIELALQAETQLPERPELAANLSKIGMDAALQDVGGFRLAEVKAMAATIRERFHKPDMAQSLLRDWLKIQRGKLSETDADGHLSLATRYEELIDDRRTALDLIRKAWKADPSSKEVGQAFRSRGYRKVGEEWIEDGSQGTLVENQVVDASIAPTVPKSNQSGLRGLGPDEVLQRLGNKPDRVVYCGSKGRLVEQWIYLDPRLIHYVNFIRTPNELKSRVTSDYSLPRTRREGKPGPPPK